MEVSFPSVTFWNTRKTWQRQSLRPRSPARSCAYSVQKVSTQEGKLPSPRYFICIRPVSPASLSPARTQALSIVLRSFKVLYCAHFDGPPEGYEMHWLRNGHPGHALGLRFFHLIDNQFFHEAMAVINPTHDSQCPDAEHIARDA